MPIYEYRCEDCEGKTAKLVRGFDAPESITCRECRGEKHPPRNIQRGVSQSLNSKLQDLDPRYDRMADSAAANTADADPQRFLKNAIPFDAADK